MFDLTWGAVKNGGPWVASAYMRAAPTVAALLLLAGCPDEQLSRVFPVIAVEPEALDFGTGIVGADNPGMLTIFDRGAAPLDIASYTIEPETPIFRVVGGPSVLPPSVKASAMVRCTGILNRRAIASVVSPSGARWSA